jgi:hypothetical protein
MLEALAVFLILMAFIDLYFVHDGWRRLSAIPESRLLRLMLRLKLISTTVAFGLAYVAADYLIGVRPVPGGGLILVAAAVVLVLIPVLIHATMLAIDSGREAYRSETPTQQQDREAGDRRRQLQASDERHESID